MHQIKNFHTKNMEIFIEEITFEGNASNKKLSHYEYEFSFFNKLILNEMHQIKEFQSNNMRIFNTITMK